MLAYQIADGISPSNILAIFITEHLKSNLIGALLMKYLRRRSQ